MHEECGEAPEARMLLQHENYGVGAGDQIFVWKVGVDCHIDRVQIAGVGAVAGKDGRGESALQRGKTEESITIAAQNEPDEAVAEPPDAIVEQDGVRHLYDTWLYFVPDAGGCGPA